MPRFSLTLTPWDRWSASSAPDWWTFGYNKIKHNRLKYPGAPTLIRAINSVAALQVLLLHYYRAKYPESLLSDDVVTKLIVPRDNDDPFQGASILWDWTIPDDKSAV